MYENTPTPQHTPNRSLKEDNQHGAWPTWVTPFPDSLTSSIRDLMDGEAAHVFVFAPNCIFETIFSEAKIRATD